jgi:hypothetical protein
LIRLLAVRDAFVAVIALMAVYVLLPATTVGQLPLPLLTLFASGLVWLVSWSLRGGSESVSITLYGGLFFMVAFVGTGVLLHLLSQAGVIAGRDSGPDLVTWIVGSVIGISVAVALRVWSSRRNR